MAEAQNKSAELERARITLGVLQAVETEQAFSQRRLASELGIALGLANAYVKRCVKKGLLKVSQAPARRYAYYLTPEGFAEKSRLASDYLSFSFAFFRRARSDCADALNEAERRGWTRIALCGVSEVAEITILCALDTKLEVVAVIGERSEIRRKLLGRAIVSDCKKVSKNVDGCVITGANLNSDMQSNVFETFGGDRILVPAFLATKDRTI